MSLGSSIRRLFGSYEHEVAEAYRSLFINLDDFARLAHAWVPHAQQILEVGCGEGAMTERLTRTYPNATVTAIDITANLGRLYRGETSNVTFIQETVEETARRQPAFFDVVILADVLHHVPPHARPSLLRAINQTMVPNGKLICKDWVISSHPIHWLSETSDRYLTGDDVEYFTHDSLDTLLTSIFGAGAIQQTGVVRPWKNNVAALVQRPAT